MQQTLHASYTIPFSFHPSSLLKIDQLERNNYILYVESMYTRQATSFAKPGNEYKMIKEKERQKKNSPQIWGDKGAYLHSPLTLSLHKKLPNNLLTNGLTFPEKL